MRARRVVFANKGEVVVEPFDLRPPGDDEILVKTLYSAISPGTELAFLDAKPGTQTATAGFPFQPGYSNVGRVVEVGAGARRFRVGQLVATLTPHVSHALLPETIGPGPPPEKHRAAFRSPIMPNAPFAPLHYIWPLADDVSPEAIRAGAAFNLASVGVTGARYARIDLGDSVAVLGLGPVGLIAAWAAKAAGGFPVVAYDPVPSRRELASQYGIDAVHADVAGFSGHPLMSGPAPRIVIEATGRPEAIPLAFKMCARNGRVVLLGSTRGEVAGVDFYNDVHRKGIEVVGAQVLTRPVHESVPGRWTAWDENAFVLRLIASRRLDVSPLLAAEFPADRAADAYRLLRSSPDAMGALLNWGALG